MALPTNLDQRERTKFRDISGSVAVAVVNSDGSAIGAAAGNATVAIGSAVTLYAVTTGGGSTTVFQGGAPWSVNVASTATLYAITTGGGSTTVFQGGAPWSVNLNSMATVTLGTGLNAIDDTVSIGDPVISGLKWGLTSLATGNPGNVALMDRQGHVADVDISGALRTFQASSATIYAITTGGGTTTVFQGGAPWSINVASTATLYAVTTGGAVNATVFQGGAPWTALVTNLNQLPLVAGTSSIGLATVHQGGAPWTALVTNLNQLPLVAGTSSIGLATVHQGGAPWTALVTNLNQLPLVAGTSSIGLATVHQGGAPWTALVTVQNPITLAAGTNSIGLATVHQGGAPWTALVTSVLNPTPILGAGLTTAIWASTATGSQLNVGLMDRQGHTADIDISGALRTFAASSATIYAIVNTGAAGQASVVLDTGTKFIGLATVVVGNSMVTVTLGTKLDFGNDSVSAVVTSLPSINGTIGLSARAHNITPFGLAGTNLSGATIFVNAASKKFYITNLVLSNASNVGVAFLNGATYLTGNPSVRMQLPEKGGFVENGSPQSPLYFGLANQTNFLIATDTAAPVSGRVTWFEE